MQEKRSKENVTPETAGGLPGLSVQMGEKEKLNNTVDLLSLHVSRCLFCIVRTYHLVSSHLMFDKGIHVNHKAEFE